MIPGSPAHSEARRKPVTLRAFEISRRSCIKLWIIATSKLRNIGCQAKSFEFCIEFFLGEKYSFALVPRQSFSISNKSQ